MPDKLLFAKRTPVNLIPVPITNNKAYLHFNRDEPTF